MERPRLKAHLKPFTLGDRVFLVAEQRHYLVQGAAAVAVLPYLDGRHTVGEIVTALEGEVSFADLVLALTKYQRFGHLAYGLDGHGDRLDVRAVAAWDLRGIDPVAAAGQLAATTVAVTTVGDADPGEVVAALRETGMTVRLADWDEAGADAGAALAVVVTDEYLDPLLGKLDAAFRAADRRWLLVKPIGAEVWAGPCFVPGETGCWQCLAQRLDGNRMVEQYLRFRSPSDLGVIRVSLAALPPSRQLAAALVAGAVAELAATGACPALEGTIVSLHAQTLQLAHHRLIRQPQCPGCGDPALTRERPARVALRSQPVAFGREGGHRVMRPDETYRRLERHISPITGVVRELSSLNDADEGITYSYAAGHNFALPSDNIAMLRRNLRGQSGGKGRTDIQARVSGMCEAIERYSGVWRDDRPTVQGSFDELGPDQAVFLPELLGYSPAQYAERIRWNQSSGGRYNQVPRPYDPSQPIAWTPAWSLTRQRERLVPAAYAWFGHPDLYRHLFCFPDGNGNSSGNVLEEAVLQAFCELVERDAVALWWYNRLRRPGVDLDRLHDPYIDQLRDYYDANRRSLWVLDITSDLGVPTFAAVSHRLDHPVQDVILGFGAHLDRRLGLLRALTELNQFLPIVSQRFPDGSTIYWEDDEYVLEWWKTARVEQEPWLRPAPGASARVAGANRGPGPGPGDSDGRDGADLRDEIETCLARAGAAGLEVLVLDQSRPDIELNVAKVIVPGMRHFWRRLGPGRLYDVPVRLGWLEAPHREQDLNPRSVFF